METLIGDLPGPNPYVDYVRDYTSEGGVALTYKTVEPSFWRTLARVTGWCVLMVVITYIVAGGFPRDGYDLAFLIVMGGVLAWLLFKNNEVMRRIEIRPDCLILDEVDVFWTRHMEAMPSFRVDEDGMHVLTGIYGTRQVDFLSIKAFDEHDRAPTVLANHIKEAINQLWFRPGAV